MCCDLQMCVGDLQVVQVCADDSAGSLQVCAGDLQVIYRCVPVTCR